MADILLTIDVEDWFQVENFKQYIPYSSWSSCELRVERNTHHLLDLFDSVGGRKLTQKSSPSKCLKRSDPQGPSPLLTPHAPEGYEPPSFLASQLQAKCRPKATFFILGWLGKRLPNLVREIHARGHEVASHGYSHELCSACSTEELKNDLTLSKKLLEDVIGAPVYGYRAPSFSINDDILKVVEQCGYLYDSSYNSFGLNSRYGKLTLSTNGSKGIAIDVSHPSILASKPSSFWELPISNLNIKKPFSYLLSAISSKQNQRGFVLPWGGGGYFRLIPFRLFQRGIKKVLKERSAYLFYMHPWEIDPGQPKVSTANRFYKFRHYTNLGSAQQKLSRLISEFKDCGFRTCSQYLDGLASSGAVLKSETRS